MLLQRPGGLYQSAPLSNQAKLVEQESPEQQQGGLLEVMSLYQPECPGLLDVVYPQRLGLRWTELIGFLAGSV